MSNQDNQSLRNKEFNNVEESNRKTIELNKNTISSLFQQLSLSGVSYFIFFIVMVSYFSIKTYIDFEVSTPVITTADMKVKVGGDPQEKSENNTLETYLISESQDESVRLIFERFLVLNTPLEIQQFVYDNAAMDELDLPNLKLTRTIELLVSERNENIHYDHEIIESTRLRGDIFESSESKIIQNPNTGRSVENMIKLTDSSYSIILKREESKYGSAMILPTIQYYGFVVDFDTNMKIINISRSSDDLSIIKYQYLDYLDDINPGNLISNVAFNSPVSALALSYENITKIHYQKFSVAKSLGGIPVGNFELTINDRLYPAYIKQAKDGFLSIYINHSGGALE